MDGEYFIHTHIQVQHEQQAKLQKISKKNILNIEKLQ